LSKNYGVYSIDLIVPLGKPSVRFNAWLLKDDKTRRKTLSDKDFCCGNPTKSHAYAIEVKATVKQP